MFPGISFLIDFPLFYFIAMNTSNNKVLSLPSSIAYVLVFAALLSYSCDITADGPPTANFGKQAVHPIPSLTQSKNTSPCVVELFTSEGCSSCPPADKLVAAAQNEFKDNSIVLSYHVDYWDRLGWKDPFSKSAYSQRQRQYAEHLNLESVYTPQIVVNGTTEFVGSNKSALWNAIGSYKNSGTGTIETETVLVSDKQLRVNYHYPALRAKENIVLELVLKNAVTQVKRGENGGATLTHINIVQDIVQKNESKGSVTFNLPANFAKENYWVVAFIQNSDSFEITNAKKIIII
jgi:hypothetical protein